MTAATIQIHNRYTGGIETEQVYGEPFLRFAYGNPLGRSLTWGLVSRPWLSRFYGWLMKRPSSVARIRPFMEAYGIDGSEFVDDPESFESFNAFFTRRLKPEARPLDERADRVVFPADGRHSGWQELGRETAVFVKGQRWNVRQLLGDTHPHPERFEGGTLVLSRLCPTDYHHYHFPVSGTVEPGNWVGRRLFSVNPIALRRRLAYLWENKRCLRSIHSPELGEVVFVEIGATNVGSIRHHPLPDGNHARKGEPAGWFEFGGSSLITLFEPGRVALADDLLEATSKGLELYAHVGDTMGTFASSMSGRACP
jgi:phosphatidylserine decarboxylase